jgi:hypothetical protein
VLRSKLTGGIKRAVRRWRFGDLPERLANEAYGLASLDALRPLLDGRRVAMVGNAGALLDSSHGAAIDAHDTIVRFNRGFVRVPASQGKRTDLAAIACKMPYGEIARFGAPPVLWLAAGPGLMSSSFLAHAGAMAVNPPSQWAAAAALLDGKRPSSGLLMLQLLRSHFRPSAVTLFGFDWKRSPTYYENPDDPRQARDGGPHGWDREEAVVRGWAIEDAAITIVPSRPDSTG